MIYNRQSRAQCVLGQLVYKNTIPNFRGSFPHPSKKTKDVSGILFYSKADWISMVVAGDCTDYQWGKLIHHQLDHFCATNHLFLICFLMLCYLLPFNTISLSCDITAIWMLDILLQTHYVTIKFKQCIQFHCAFVPDHSGPLQVADQNWSTVIYWAFIT